MPRLKVFCWNLFHGRDAPPDPALLSRRSKWLGRSEHNETHLQLNRDLYDAFAALIAAADWDVAALQECPPRWRRPLERDCRARSARSLTSRNTAPRLSAAIARRLPDLLGSWEGGSNLTLVRGEAGEILETFDRELTRRPERRTAIATRLSSGVTVVNLHASGPAELAIRDTLAAAAFAVEAAGGDPLILAGDLNESPASSRGLYEQLAADYGLAPPATDLTSIDQILGCGFTAVTAARPWPPEAREIAYDGLRVRLSDHAPLEAAFETG